VSEIKIKRWSLNLLNEPIEKEPSVINIDWPDEIEIKGPINLEPEKTYEFHGSVGDFMNLLERYLLNTKLP